MNRSSFFFTLGFFLAASHASAQTQRSGPAVESARAAAARLGAAIGRPVEVQRSLGGIPVLVDAPGLTPNATLRALALALHASVVNDGKAIRLERASTDQKIVGAAHLAMSRDRIADGLSRWNKILLRADKLGDVVVQMHAARAEVARIEREIDAASESKRYYSVPVDLMGEAMVSPVGRLLRELLARLGPGRLASVEPGKMLFFSNRPSAAELSLPNCNELVAAYSATQERYATAKGLPSSTGAPTKVILSASENWARLELYDPKGRRLDRGAMSYAVQVFFRGNSQPPADLTPRWVERDEASRRVAAVFSGTSGELTPEELPETVLHPEKWDPLGYDVRTCLLALPRPPDAPALVAALDDRLPALAGESLRGERLNAAAFEWRMLSERGGYERLNRDGVTLLRPRDPLAVEATLADREILGRELRRVIAARDYGSRSRTLFRSALYTGRSEVAADAGYAWVPNRLFGPIVNDPPDGALALRGAALRAGTVEADATMPPFDWLVRDGVAKGWLRFDGPPGTSDLDRAPSTVLVALDHARIACATSETPIAMRYGGMTEAQVRKGFSGDDPETLGAGVAEMIINSAVPEARKRKLVQSLLEDVRYFVGRRRTDTVEVRLQNGLRARLEFPSQIAERGNLTFADLPTSMREGILRGVQKCFDNPPKPGTGMALPTNGLPVKP